MKSATNTSSMVLEDRKCFDQAVVHCAQAVDPSFAVLLVGLDRFKVLNQTLGPAIGDRLLILVRKRLLSALRDVDRILRMPGDEFAILLHPLQSADVPNIVAERFLSLLRKPFVVHSEVITLSASIGIALGPQSGTDGEALLRRAGIALRCAKALGTGKIQLFDIAMENSLISRHALILDLRKALPLRQLEVFYQPQVDLATETLIGFEALLRWRHPELGWVSPAEFIPLAEENDLIGTIGDWVLRTACQVAAELPENIVMAVNASPLQFRTGSFVRSVENALSLTDLPPTRLEIEITEGVLLQNGEEMVTILNDLRSGGVRLAMDDFGTGYSSLSQLSRLPFDTIKIDQSLIGGNAKQRPIVRAIVMLAAALGMSTLAEGIETEEQLMNTRLDGCTSAQGYLFGKPLPASHLPAVLERFSKLHSTKREVAEVSL